MPLVSEMTVHQVAGALIPALTTTTAAVAGLLVTELLKLAKLRADVRSMSGISFASFLRTAAQNKRGSLLLSQFRNSFVNVNTSEIIQSQPADAVKLPILQTSWFGRRFKRYSEWDRIKVTIVANVQ